MREVFDLLNVPEKLVAEYVEQLTQIKMRKEKKKEETERDWMERLNRQYNDIDWAGLYNSDKLSSLRVDELSLYFPISRSPWKERKLSRSQWSKRTLVNSMER